jgi:hypothetical protein
MKSLWAIAAALKEIAFQLERMNRNAEANQPDLTRRPGERDGEFFRRLQNALRKAGG